MDITLFDECGESSGYNMSLCVRSCRINSALSWSNPGRILLLLKKFPNVYKLKDMRIPIISHYPLTSLMATILKTKL